MNDDNVNKKSEQSEKQENNTTSKRVMKVITENERNKITEQLREASSEAPDLWE